MFLFTVFMLVITAWLFFNALNELRWVQAHSHDESVASDPGFLPNFSSVSHSMGLDGSSGKVSIDQENTAFARTVAKVRSKTARFSEGLEKRAAAARVEPGDRPRSAGDEDSFFGRMVDRVRGLNQRVDDGLEQRMEASRNAGESAPRGGAMASQTTAFERLASRVGERDEALAERITRKAKDREASGNSGYFNKIVATVSGWLEAVDRRVDARLQKSRVEPSERNDPARDDLIGRTAMKVGTRVNDATDRLIYPGSKSGD